MHATGELFNKHHLDEYVEYLNNNSEIVENIDNVDSEKNNQ
jgi:hypothetical protein